MLGNKAKPRRLNSKGNLRIHFGEYRFDTRFTKVGRALSKSIPVLSIFALVGIISYAIGITVLEDITNTGSESAYAVTIPDGTPSASLTISGNGTTEQISAGRGSTAYRTHTVNVKAGDISDYSIIITGPSNMTSPSGGSVIAGTDGNKTGESLATNTWGYAWGDSTSENDAMTYKALSTGGTNLTSSDKPTISNNAVEFSRKLVFAVKFDEDTAEGRYYADNVNLALTVNPKLIVVGVWTNPDNTTRDSGISTMQAMTYDICSDSNVKTGATMLLQDSRDDNIYSIGKLADGKCWMRENLRTAGGAVMTNSDTDLNGISAYTLPAATDGGFDSTVTNTSSGNTYTNQQIYSATDRAYGAYYSWCAATAGSCMTDVSTPVYSGKDASSSICPKGWKLPKGGDGGDYQVLYEKNPGTAPTAWSYNAGSSGHWLGAVSAADGGAFFQAAGGVSGNNLGNVGSYGRYWTRTAYNIAGAYRLGFTSSYVGADYDNRYYGFSVRCVVEEPVKTIKTITKMQEMTPEICKASKIGDTTTLTDTRDQSTYTVKKLNDEQCWMTQNLRIVNKTIYGADVSGHEQDSDMASGSFTIPGNNLSDFTGVNNNAAYYDTEANDTTYGAYYSWFTATAGTGTNIISNGDASSSICPKGWKLPAGTPGVYTNDFAIAIGLGTINITAGGTNYWNSLTNPSFADGILTVNNATWPAAGLITIYGTSDTKNLGIYWSRTAYNATQSYYFRLGGFSAHPAYYDARHFGVSIRCIAYSN